MMTVCTSCARNCLESASANPDFPLAVGPDITIILSTGKYIVQGAKLDKDNVVTLIANPERFKLSDKEVGVVVDALQHNGAIITEVKWLEKDIACDIYFAVLEALEARELLWHLLDGVELDYIVQFAGYRKKNMLISDMDSSMIEQECIDEIAGVLGLKEEIAKITERAMNGELEFEEALIERVKRLKGVTEKQLQEVFDKKITPMPGAKDLIATMKANGAKCILVSGGFTFFTTRVLDMLGFDIDESNRLIMENGVLTGEVSRPILGKQAKLDALSFYAEKFGLRTHNTLAIGDGANDLPMLLAAGLGVAYHAKPTVRSLAKAKIDTCDLTALLYAQGYKSEDFVRV